MTIAEPQTSPVACPEPGVYPDVSLREYLMWDAVSSTFLKGMRRSPAHAKYERDHHEWTEALKIGDAVHRLTLQPAAFAQEFVQAEQCGAFTGKGQRCSKPGTVFDKDGAFLCWQHATDESEKCVLNETQWERVHGTSNAILLCEPASILLNDDGPVELSIVWDDPHTGLRCKARIDKLCKHEKLRTVADIKTTTDARPEKFAKAIYDYGHDIQAAHNLNGCVALKDQLPTEPEGFAIIAAESEPYHGVSVFDMDINDIESAGQQIKKFMPRIAECRRLNDWPGYTTDIIKLGMPAWVQKRINERMQVQT